MANPDFQDESTADQSGAGPTTVFMPAAWAANQIALLFVATDGWVPTLSTPNGFVLATDPNGNVASVTTNGGVAGANDCGMFVFWKRLVGSTTATDPAPVVAAAPGGAGGTVETMHINTYINCRTTGTPFHIIATAIVGTATTTIAPPAVTPTLNGCTLVTTCASANDDSSFNSWTFTGAASPAGTLDNGWHGATGNGASFVGGRGGYATAGGSRSGTSTFGSSTKQAQITLVLASLPEVGTPDETVVVPQRVHPAPALVAPRPVDDELPQQAASAALDDDSPMVVVVPQPAAVRAPVAADDEVATSTVTSAIDEDSSAPVVLPSSRPAVQPTQVDDEIPTPETLVVDDDPWIPQRPASAPTLVVVQAGSDELVPAVVGAQIVDDEPTPPPPVLLVPPPRPIQLDVSEVVPQPSAPGIGGAGDAQRSLNQPPQTGTLTTPAPVASWVTSHAYVVDPTAGGINRVQNGGTLYQCSQDGTSASSGSGPTSTTPGATVIDGTAHWYVIGPVNGTDTAAGSQILATVMRGTQSFVGASIDPSDNDGGSFSVITNNAYAGFPQSFAGVWRRTTAANTKTGYQASALWGGSGGAGDEQSVVWVELQGVVTGAPHASSHVERASPTGGTVTAANITTTVTCLVVSFWFGNGTTQSAGAPDAATPAGGLTLIPGCTGPLSLTPNGYIQHMVAWRIAAPGTFAEVWTASPTNEGAQLVTVAFPVLSATLAVDEDSPVVQLLPAGTAARIALQVADELGLRVVLDEDSPMRWVPPDVVAPVPVRVDADELPVLVVEENSTVVVAPPPAPSVRWMAPVDDEPPSAAAAIVDEESALVAAMVAPPAPRVWWVPVGDDLPALALDDDSSAPVPLWTTAPRVSAPVSDDELPVATAASTIVDDDGFVATPLLPVTWAFAPAVSSDDWVPVDLGNRVHIPGVAPDPEVYDYTGTPPAQELYGGH